MSLREVVITGLGVVSPIGIGRQRFWTSLMEGTSGVARLTQFDPGNGAPRFGGEVRQFDPTQYVRPRKSLKVMSRDMQLAFAAADMAVADAELKIGSVEPERLAVVFGADMVQALPEEMAAACQACTVDGQFDYSRWGDVFQHEIYPLWMLKHLPNMPACHIGIYLDARGPMNTHTLGEVSSLLAISEAVRVIERDQADIVVAGGGGARIHPTVWIRSSAGQMSRRGERPEQASRPFDAQRDGFVNGEGAAAFVLESRKHAQRRGANIHARLLSYSSAFGTPRRAGGDDSLATRQAIEVALRGAGLKASEVGHVNADGLSTTRDDAAEARAIEQVLGQAPVTAPKSFFGNLGAGTGAVEMAASVLAIEHGQIPFTLNYRQSDPACPVSVVRDHPLPMTKGTALVLSRAPTGQACAVVLAAPD